MKVVYVCGYGRSGSTLLGRVLAHSLSTITVGEMTHTASYIFLAKATCACGAPFPKCDFWREVDVRLRRLANNVEDGPRAQLRKLPDAVEGTLGLLISSRRLNRLVQSRRFSDRYPLVTFAEGLKVVAKVSGCSFVDTSKTTRHTANRPRLIAACGTDLELHLASRPLHEVINSYQAAQLRAGRGTSRWLAACKVTWGRALAMLAAKTCAHLLDIPLHTSTLLESIHYVSSMPSSANRYNHMIAGNRSRHAPALEGEQ